MATLKTTRTDASVDDFLDGFDDLLARLGNPRTGQGCLYLTRVADVDLGVLEDLISRSAAQAVES
ncbi:hypothetical protein [Krasilnikovia sp. M28-CT-15]|uniref:hypothetical protein n=1 Tax=Krasilnikovia sp. M28-CT-15 TaxID=3373540 RepID=UPI003876D206